MSDRRLLVETPEFEAILAEILDVLTRIVAERALGMVIFRDYFLMDVEQLSGGRGSQNWPTNQSPFGSKK